MMKVVRAFLFAHQHQANLQPTRLTIRRKPSRLNIGDYLYRTNRSPAHSRRRRISHRSRDSRYGLGKLQRRGSHRALRFRESHLPQSVLSNRFSEATSRQIRFRHVPPCSAHEAELQLEFPKRNSDFRAITSRLGHSATAIRSRNGNGCWS